MAPEVDFNSEQFCSRESTAPSTDPTELSDFFGGAWDFCPNGTFSDLPDSRFPNKLGFNLMPNVEGMGENNVQVEEEVVSPATNNTTSINNVHSPNSTTLSPSKNKPPNLYEALRRSQMMPAPAMMMGMSPLNNYADNSFFNGLPGGVGLDWTQALDPIALTGGMMPTSPQMVMDPQQYNLLLMQAARMKRPRVSPYLGAGNLESGAFASSAYGGLGLGFPGMNRMNRLAKMPLSPVHRNERNIIEPTENTSSRTMPLVLPFSVTGGSSKLSSKPSIPVKLMPAKPTIEGGPSKQMLCTEMPTSLEDNIERNLRSFLQDTRDLEWDNVTVVELKRILRQYELNATGKKSELMQRIKKIRHSYRHLEEVAPVKTVVTMKKNFAVTGLKLNGGDKRADSSPDTMGSDNGLDPSAPSAGLSADALDSLFAGPLDMPAGHHELLFTSSS